MKKYALFLCFCILASSFLLVACYPKPYENWDRDVQKLVDAGFEAEEYTDEYLAIENNWLNNYLKANVDWINSKFSVDLTKYTRLQKNEDQEVVVLYLFATKEQANNVFDMYVNVERDVYGSTNEYRFFQIESSLIITSSKVGADILGYDFVRYGDLKTDRDYTAWIEDSQKLNTAGFTTPIDEATTEQHTKRLNEWLKENKQTFKVKIRGLIFHTNESDTFECARIEFVNRVQAEQFHNFYVSYRKKRPDSNKSCRIGRVVIIAASQEVMDLLGYDFE